MAISFKLEDNYNKKKKSNRLSIIFVLVLIAVISFSLYFIYNNSFSFIEKLDSSKDYVYTVKKIENSFEEDTYDEVPLINLAGEQYEKINNIIMNKYIEVSRKSDYNYHYEFSVSKNILSLMVTYAYYPNDTAMYPIRYFETFNIDLRNGNILSDDDILDKYGLNQERVNSFLEVKFKSFYGDLVNKNYYTEQECNYDCFLKNRGISSNYLNGVSYYIEDGSLIALKYFYTYSLYEEEQYFKNEDYEFIVKK